MISFFLRYLIRSNVFPEEEAALKRALELCNLAKKELPATWTLGRAIPDKVSKGLEDLNTMMTTGMYGRGLVFDDDGSDEDDEADQPDSKKRKLEAAEELFGDEVQVIDPEKMDLDATAHADAITDNVDVNGAEVEPSGWGVPGEENDATWKSDDVSGGWGSAWNDNAGVDISGWTATFKNDLFDYLGPTSLPFTHTTGIVERSTRKIVRVIRPPPTDATNTKDIKDLSQVEAIEQDFETKMGHVIFAPWVKVGNHVASDILPPDILPDSRGAAIIPELTKSDLMNYGIRNGGRASMEVGPSTTDATSGLYPAFDPKKDEICLVVDPKLLDLFEQSIGMGVCATWVQIARKETPGDDVNEPIDFTSKKGRKKPRPIGAPGKNGEPTKWWYMEQVSFALTSFHADKYFADQED